MLRLVAKNEPAPKAPEFSENYQKVLRRIVGLTSGKRSRGEWEALLLIFRWVTKDLESKIASMSEEPKLRVVE